MRELVESGRYDTREDFSVVLQPFFHSIRLPTLEVGPTLPMGFRREEDVQGGSATCFQESVTQWEGHRQLSGCGLAGAASLNG